MVDNAGAFDAISTNLWCFPVNFVKFLATPFLQNTSRRLLLMFYNQIHSNLLYPNNDTLEVYHLEKSHSLFQIFDVPPPGPEL